MEVDHGVEVDEEDGHALDACGCRPSQGQHNLHLVHQLTFCLFCAGQSFGHHVADALGA